MYKRPVLCMPVMIFPKTIFGFITNKEDRYEVPCHQISFG
jgi:hypothetical protein